GASNNAATVAILTNMCRTPGTGGGALSVYHTALMLKGSKRAVVRKVQPVSIHGQGSLDVHYVEPDELQGQVRIARVGQESVPRDIEAGDEVDLHFVVGVVTHITKP